MNITKAFIERNRLKKYISEKSATLQMARISHQADTGERSWEDTGGVTLDELIASVIRAKFFLAELNKAIDAANAKGSRELLDELEGLKAKKATYDGLLAKARNFREKESVAVDGKYTVVGFVLDFNLADIKEKAKIAERDIEAFEDKIAEKNASTEVVLTPQLVEFLSTYKD